MNKKFRNKDFNCIDKFSSAVDTFARAILAVMLSVMIIVVLFGVINRFLLKLPISWTEEIARFLMIWICMLGSTIAIKNGTHVAVLFFISKLDNKIRRKIALLNHLLIISFLLIPSLYGIKLCISQAGQLSPALRISMFFPFFSVPFGCIIMILHELSSLKAMFIRETQNDQSF
ncbi:MAG: TRAP transporter small permease [Candidatus Hermodarchaeota archaeon]